ncbi:hypothetical protein [Xanthomonas sp. WHRI 7945]|nr:hypothetical protein [Xanthomonas campestris pv. campestris]
MHGLPSRPTDSELGFTLLYNRLSIEDISAEYRSPVSPPDYKKSREDYLKYPHGEHTESDQHAPPLRKKPIRPTSLRPPLRVNIKLHGGKSYIISALHCYSHPGNISVQLEQIKECISGLDNFLGQSRAPPHIIIGDMNIDARENKNLGVISRMMTSSNRRLKHAIPEMATHRGGTLDWAIVDISLDPEINAYVPRGDANKPKDEDDYQPTGDTNPSDHKAIILKIGVPAK